jgi:hypothetical protein
LPPPPRAPPWLLLLQQAGERGAWILPRRNPGTARSLFAASSSAARRSSSSTPPLRFAQALTAQAAAMAPLLAARAGCTLRPAAFDPLALSARRARPAARAAAAPRLTGACGC